MTFPANHKKYAHQKAGGRVVLLSIALVLMASLTHAQGESSIWGLVTDATGGAIPGATLELQNLETGAARDLITDSSGRYDAPLLSVGTYKVTARKEGFQTESRTGVTLVVGQHAEIDITLPLTELRQTVTVTEQPRPVSATTEDFSGLVGEKQVKDLPLNGRSYDQLLTLNPGIVNYTSERAGGIGTSNSVLGNMFAVSGRRPQENLYLLNGVEYTGASEINVTPGGASGQLLGVDAVREFAVVTDTYGAEYGKRPGAQINIMTASGTNQLHGSAYEFLRNSAFDSRNYFDEGPIPAFQRSEFGGSLGGPIRKDNTFLFGNYEGFRQRLGVSGVAFVPDANARQGFVAGPNGTLTNAGVAASVAPLLALWPKANGPDLGDGIAEAFSHPLQTIREDFGTSRFDRTFSNKDSFAGVYTIDDSFANTPAADPLSQDIVTLREQVASLSETHIFSPTAVNKATFGFSRGGFYFSGQSLVDLAGFVPGKPIGAVVVGGGTTLNGASQITTAGTNAGSNLAEARNLFTAEDQATAIRGIHQFNFGAWFERIQSNDDLAQDQWGQAAFSTLTSFLQASVSTFTVAPSTTPLNWRSLEGAAYAEDVLKFTLKLELRLGFRGEFTNGWNEANGRASNYTFDPSGVIVAQPLVGSSALATNNARFLPAPRIGIAWSPFWNKTVIRFGFGIYYALLDDLSYRLDQNPPFNTVFAIKAKPLASDEAALETYVPGGPLPAGAQVSPSGVQPNLKTPTVFSYTLKIDQEINSSTSLSVGYVGSRGLHELLSLDANVPVPAVCPASPCPASYPAGLSYNPPGAPLANPSVGNTTTWFSEGVSWYNGLNVDLNHRMNRGLQLRGVYTFSKGLDDGDNMNTSIATNSPAFTANPLNPLADYGRASFDIRHSGVINATYEVPLRHPGARGSDRWLNEMIGDWQISGIETFQTGLPFTPQLGYNPANDGDSRNPVRPSWNPSFAGQIIEGKPSQYFNPGAFAQPLPGTYGNTGRNVLQGPGLVETDVSLARKIPLTERIHLQFRAEFFNLFNHTNFNTPNAVVFTSATGPASPTAGIITATTTSSRQIQFGLKLLF